MRALHLALALAAARAALQRAPCEHFIILKYAHTGSTWFVDELNGIEILATRKPSDIVKRSNSQVKKMVAPRADIKSPRRRRAIGANRSFRAGDERGRGRGLVRRVGRAGAALAHVS